MASSERKRPRQARAQETVRAILEATVQILDREGLEAATTTRIAEVAGVSIGSLYQYFSHRDAILNALQNREFERTLELMQKVLAEGNLGEEPEKTIKAALHGLAELYLASPGLHRVLAIEGLRVAKAEHVHAFDLRVIEVVRHFLASTEAPIQTENVGAAAFLVFQTVRAAMLSFLLERPPGLDIDRLIEELTRLLIGYLLGPSRPNTKKIAARRVTKRRS
ncbi:transcriptional regulator, TetR family [Labilithrix luteola]|uniref:Transcriptional regulator, TetR family n=1 Tax=Labilithrix luteola TaxID=1391654 RepID=A0A0K1Q0E5_9BACT|nr:TetR/AcrR family transcriptional regulator [Labilithrix luteola]AKU99121.1 transcriptional regulator, TetR family [Labilithrix luteola]